MNSGPDYILVRHLVSFKTLELCWKNSTKQCVPLSTTCCLVQTPRSKAWLWMQFSQLVLYKRFSCWSFRTSSWHLYLLAPCWKSIFSFTSNLFKVLKNSMQYGWTKQTCSCQLFGLAFSFWSTPLSLDKFARRYQAKEMHAFDRLDNVYKLLHFYYN